MGSLATKSEGRSLVAILWHVSGDFPPSELMKSLSSRRNRPAPYVTQKRPFAFPQTPSNETKSVGFAFYSREGLGHSGSFFVERYSKARVVLAQHASPGGHIASHVGRRRVQYYEFGKQNRATLPPAAL